MSYGWLASSGEQYRDTMLWICEILSQDFNFIRIDLYNVNGRIFWGELTFTPGDGMARLEPRELDYQFGE